jgi:hypothetical protein
MHTDFEFLSISIDKSKNEYEALTQRFSTHSVYSVFSVVKNLSWQWSS